MTAKQERWLNILGIVILFFGIAWRVYIYLQNRGLIMDEANIARNIYERGFAGLAQPLSYEQYAPPVFLWIVKLCSILFGFSEYALRLYPLICGIASLFVLRNILKEELPHVAVWYPLALFAIGFMMLRFSSELKQYMPDVLITLSLIWLTIKTGIDKAKPLRFVLIWTIAGSIAIWSSMPSVFILGGVGAYYKTKCLQQKNYNKLLLIVFPAIVWASQFLYYYFTVLAPQASSDYLQRFHSEYFLNIVGAGAEYWGHNRDLIKGLISVAGGYTAIATIFHTILIVVAMIYLLKKYTAKAMLLAVPLILLFAASAMHRFSLLDRVSLFIIPVLVLLIGYGGGVLMKLKPVVVKYVVTVVMLVCVVSFISITINYRKKYEQVTEGLAFLNEHKVAAEHTYIFHAAVPGYIYYTTIHPHHYTPAGAHLLYWNMNYDSLALAIQNNMPLGGDAGVLYSNATRVQFEECSRQLKDHLHETDRLDKPYVQCSIYSGSK